MIETGSRSISGGAIAASVVQGFLNLNKPTGMTSHDCVGQVRRLLKMKQVGHGGTLDPLATGVLPIALGRATRLLQFLPQGKSYQATIRLGVTTTTDDLAGEIITTQPTDLNLATVQAALQSFLGPIQQVPPAYSAVQVQGQRLYHLARSGKPIAAAARSVEVFKLEILDWRPGVPASGSLPELDVAIACGPGTYIRAIARDLGAMLQTGGTLAALTRTESSGFILPDSLTFAELEAHVAAGSFHPIPAEVALKHLRAIALPPELAQRWCWGQKLSLDLPAQPGTLRVYHEDGRFLGVAKQIVSTNGPILVPQMVFALNL